MSVLPRLIAPLLALLSAMPLAAEPLRVHDAAEPAALILQSGRIHTADGVVEALAVDQRGVIVALGKTAELASWRGPATRVIELAGHSVLPGFHDVHVHPVFGGILERQCKIPQGSTLEIIQKHVAACAARASAGAWIVGGQWDASAIGRVPDKAMLDAAAPANPVVLDDTSGHSGWANTKALALAGIVKATADPAGGIIERDAAGEPTGVLRETAVDLVKTKVPLAADAELRAALAWALHEMLAVGITSFTEASVGFSAGMDKELAAWDALAEDGTLKQRARLCLTWTPGKSESEDIIAAHNRYDRARLTADCVKIFLDGVPTDSHTAAMLDPYEGSVQGRDDEAARKGLLLVPQPALDAAVTRFDRMGLTVKFHAAGDAAVRAGLDAIAAARKANGFSTLAHNVGHCTFVAKNDLARARAIGATFEVSPYLWDPSPINDDITHAVGSSRIERVWPVREMLDAGALVVPGSDWAVVPSVNPWIAVETLVTRENPGGSARSFGKPQAITVEEAIRLFTANSARQEGSEDRLGRIAPGMVADLVVLDRDPYAVAAKTLHETTVLGTIINGEIVYQREAGN